MTHIVSGVVLNHVVEVPYTRFGTKNAKDENELRVVWRKAWAYEHGLKPPRYPVPATSLYYDGPKHIAVAYQTMVHSIPGNHDLIRDYWTWY